MFRFLFHPRASLATILTAMALSVFAITANILPASVASAQVVYPVTMPIVAVTPVTGTTPVSTTTPVTGTTPGSLFTTNPVLGSQLLTTNPLLLNQLLTSNPLLLRQLLAANPSLANQLLTSNPSLINQLLLSRLFSLNQSRLAYPGYSVANPYFSPFYGNGAYAYPPMPYPYPPMAPYGASGSPYMPYAAASAGMPAPAISGQYCSGPSGEQIWVSSGAPVPSGFTCGASAGAQPSQSSETSTVSMANLSFNPATITVMAGTTVTWMNADSVPHTVTADNGSFDKGTVAPGMSVSMTFSTPGTFAYHCNIHPFMHGTVTVQ